MILSAKDDSTIRPHTDFVNQHYIPQMIIRNFSNVNPSGKTYNTFYVDLNDPEQKIQKRNTERIFCKNSIYDMKGEDPTRLEKAFNACLEKPMRTLLKELSKNKFEINIDRVQLYFLKKYLLMQMYRTPKNREAYRNQTHHNYASEDNFDFWKETMFEILTKKWTDLAKSENTEIQRNYHWLDTSFLIFVRTFDEFIITDAGNATERHCIQISDEQKTE